MPHGTKYSLKIHVYYIGNYESTDVLIIIIIYLSFTHFSFIIMFMFTLALCFDPDTLNNPSSDRPLASRYSIICD